MTTRLAKRLVGGSAVALALAPCAVAVAAGGEPDMDASTGVPLQDKRERQILQLRKQADKARARAQERVSLGSHEMLGMTPKLWLEALDEDHRYGSVLHFYWQRWEASRARWMFFDWLDRGRGSLIDLPTCPRRLLEETKTIYMTREQLRFCECEIKDGRLLWCADGEPVTLPMPPAEVLHQPETPRARAISVLIEERLATTRRREALLSECRAATVDAMRHSKPPTPEALRSVTTPLVQEGLLRMLRDPHFHERSVVLPTIQDDGSYQQMWEQFKVRSRWRADGSSRVDAKAKDSTGPSYALPLSLLPNLSWSDVLEALDHEEGSAMADGSMKTAQERLQQNKPGKGGIFVVDQYGTILAAQKVTGALHHSSLTGGKCCRFAGNVTVKDGHILMVTPHSGHYVPTQAEYDLLLESWRQQGLDLSRAKIGGFAKEHK